MIFFDYNNVRLIPKKCIVNSRRFCDTSVQLGNMSFNMPVYPANMKSVVNVATCKYMARNNWFYTMHRFGVDLFDFIIEMQKEDLFTSISVGVNEDSYKVLYSIYNEPLEVDYITIDVANAWSEKCKMMIKYIRDKFPETFLIVGNVATPDAIEELSEWGAMAIKVGIGPGAACTSYLKTGVGTRGWQLSAVQQCSNISSVPIIADGGIVNHGDIAKAIACGADMVMAGSLFAGYDQSSGEIVEIDNIKYKEYYGSASEYNKKERINIEGKKILVTYKGDMDKLLEELKQDLQSAISYVGASDLEGLQKADFYIL